jgi:hypothetical protein
VTAVVLLGGSHPEVEVWLCHFPVPTHGVQPVVTHDDAQDICSVLQKEPARPGQAPSYVICSSVVQAIPAHAHAVSRAPRTPEAKSEPSVLSGTTLPRLLGTPSINTT